MYVLWLSDFDFFLNVKKNPKLMWNDHVIVTIKFILDT